MPTLCCAAAAAAASSSCFFFVAAIKAACSCSPKSAISVKGEEILQAEEDLAEAEELERTQYGDMKLRIQFMYEQGDGSVIETIMSAESFTDLVNKAEYVS